MLFSRRSSRPRGLAALLPGRALLAALLLALLAPLAQAEDGKRLRIGITLHPYYSYVSNIVGDKAEVVPLIPPVSTRMPTSRAPRTSSASARSTWWCSTASATTISPSA